MTVATYEQPNFTTQTAAAYKANLDAASDVMAKVAAAFAPHEAATPNMTVVIDAGSIQNGTTLTAVAQQTTATITAPVSFGRYDRIVIDEVTGVYTIVTGVEGAALSALNIPAGKIAVAHILLSPSTTAITNSLITDERPLNYIPLNISGHAATADVATTATTATGLAAVREAVCQKNTDQAILNNTFTPVTFNVEVYDTDSIHDNVTNNERLTVPSGVSQVKVGAAAFFVNHATGYRTMGILKNGGIVGPIAGLVDTVCVTSGTIGASLRILSPVINVSPGDYFYVQVYQNSGITLDIDASYTEFWMEIIA